MNTCVFMGRLAKDPEVTTIMSQGREVNVAHFMLVVKRNFSSQVFTIRVAAYNQNAEFVRKYLEKGTKVMVSGELVITRLGDQNSDKVTYYTELIMGSIEFGASRTEMEKNNGNGGFHSMPEGAVPFDIPDDLETPFK
ncbi:MAG: single-stranded DNA-binding protein [Eubacteriales bacterium]|nr:single-stranded DNA-binding protein [Eubacteriales bacterium]